MIKFSFNSESTDKIESLEYTDLNPTSVVFKTNEDLGREYIAKCEADNLAIDRKHLEEILGYEVDIEVNYKDGKKVIT